MFTQTKTRVMIAFGINYKSDLFFFCNYSEKYIQIFTYRLNYNKELEDCVASIFQKVKAILI